MANKVGGIMWPRVYVKRRAPVGAVRAEAALADTVSYTCKWRGHCAQSVAQKSVVDIDMPREVGCGGGDGRIT